MFMMTLEIPDFNVRDIDGLIRDADENGDGRISFNEFVRLLKAKGEASLLSHPPNPRQLQDAFRRLDANGDGVLSRGELKMFAREFVQTEGLSKQYVEKLLREADRNGDGKIDYDEFLRMCNAVALSKRLNDPMDTHEVMDVFQRMDADGNGYLSAGELRLFADMLQGENKVAIDADFVEMLVDECDLDGDGKVDYVEFHRLFNAHQCAEHVDDPSDEREMRRVFEKLDSDGNAYLCAPELRIFLTSLDPSITAKIANRLIADADSHGDGKLDFHDFLTLLSAADQATR